MKLNDRQLCEILGSLARYIEAVKRNAPRDAQIFKDLLAREMQQVINHKG